jgi:hypothetical protein
MFDSSANRYVPITIADHAETIGTERSEAAIDETRQAFFDRRPGRWHVNQTIELPTHHCSSQSAARSSKAFIGRPSAPAPDMPESRWILLEAT